MILSFLGKGGSGKSSVSTQFIYYLNEENKKVLGIDADHNMDLSFNLIQEKNISINYLGDSSADLLKYAQEEKYEDIFLKQKRVSFTLTPKDCFTKKYTKKICENLYLMIAGRQTEDILFGKSCSHALSTALKTYLPLLKLNRDEFVILDEKAGADGVTTGIVTGIDVGIIVFEASLYGIKTAKQISELMDFYKTPYIFVANKIQSKEDKNFVESNFNEKKIFYLPFSNQIKQNPFKFENVYRGQIKLIIEEARRINLNNRMDRTLNKFRRNFVFKKNSF